jgi:DNA-3-methyladenine glycosylase II
MNAIVHHLTNVDPVMAELVARIGAPDLKPRRLPPFQSLAHAIIHQQLGSAAAGTILNRFKALFDGDTFPTPTQVVRLDADRLRTAGLSRQKANYIRDLAQKTIDGVVPSLKECDRLSDAELVERLTSIKGVGRWTVEMLLIFNLGRPDVLPVHDLGVRRGFQVAYRKRKMPAPEQLDRYGARWSPHRTTAALYLWRAADFLKDGEW